MKDNINYIVKSNYFKANELNFIQVFNFNGSITKVINNSNESTFFIDIYYDKKISNIFIIAGNKGYIKSYDYKNNILKNKYFVKENTIANINRVIVLDNEE